MEYNKEEKIDTIKGYMKEIMTLEEKVIKYR